jgi:hypothetical protein
MLTTAFVTFLPAFSNLQKWIKDTFHRIEITFQRLHPYKNFKIIRKKNPLCLFKVTNCELKK